MPTARCSTRIQPKSQRAVSESTAFLMSSMLADVINAGTAYKARQAGFTLPAAGKTGTTNDYVDAWFVGFTPHLVTGVWVGFDQPQTIVSNGYAGELAVPIWAAFMKAATKGDKPDWFDRPANVVGVNVCRLSGKLPNAGCEHVQVVDDDGNLETRSLVYTDYFVKGTQPTTMCPLHPPGSFLERLPAPLARTSPTQCTPISRCCRRARVPQRPREPTATSGAPGQGDRVTGGTTRRAEEEAGFWRRIFGGGKKDDQKDENKDKNDKKPDGDRRR